MMGEEEWFPQQARRFAEADRMTFFDGGLEGEWAGITVIIMIESVLPPNGAIVIKIALTLTFRSKGRIILSTG
jgi:hypothetical protein